MFLIGGRGNWVLLYKKLWYWVLFFLRDNFFGESVILVDKEGFSRCLFDILFVGEMFFLDDLWVVLDMICVILDFGWEYGICNFGMFRVMMFVVEIDYLLFDFMEVFILISIEFILFVLVFCREYWWFMLILGCLFILCFRVVFFFLEDFDFLFLREDEFDIWVFFK